MTSDNDDNARARLIKTRRGTHIDESLLPAARQECLQILREATCQSEDEGIVEMLRGEREHLEDSPLAKFTYTLDRRELMWGALSTLNEKLSKYQLSEEWEVWTLAYDADKTAGVCGCCSRELSLEEPAYFGARVYVGMKPLLWKLASNPRICEPCYVRTVLCESCAPEWLSPERDDMVTQLCGHCERPMVYRFTTSELGRTFCSETCGDAFRNQARKERRATEGEKVCKVCGKEFTATRRDAKTCSPACKQSAYRQRNKEVKQDE